MFSYGFPEMLYRWPFVILSQDHNTYLTTLIEVHMKFQILITVFYIETVRRLILVSPKEYSDHPLRSDLFFNHRHLIQILLQNANQFLNNDWLG